MMHTSTIRMVQPAEFPLGHWVVRRSPGGSVVATERTQQAALDTARADLRANGGGTVIVYGLDGTEKRRVTVPPVVREEPGEAATAEPVTPVDLIDAAGAAGARVQGRAFDRDGDGEADGDATLNRLVELGPDGEAKTAIRHAKQWLGWLATGLALFPFLPASFISADLGGGFMGIFLGTLAWSLGVAIIAGALFGHRGAWSAIWLSALGFVAFWVSNWVAGEFGGTVLNAAAPLPTQQLPYGVIPWIGDIMAAAIENYGWFGFGIATVLGGLVGWRAAELYRLSNP